MRAVKRKALEGLRADHERLRWELLHLSCLLEDTSSDSRRLTEQMNQVLFRLRQHMRRESRLTSLCSRLLCRFGFQELNQLSIEHSQEERRLQLIRRCLTDRGVRALAKEWIELFERHMNTQEMELFPLLENVLSSEETLRGSWQRRMPCVVGEVPGWNGGLVDLE